MKHPSTSSRPILKSGYLVCPHPKPVPVPPMKLVIGRGPLAKMLKPRKRRKSHLYLMTTYSGGWFIRAFDIADTRRLALKALLNHRFSGGYVVRRRATKADIAWGYPTLKT